MSSADGPGRIFRLSGQQAGIALGFNAQRREVLSYLGDLSLVNAILGSSSPDLGVII
ncbi:MAG: hypothetical protein IPK04_05875 [Bdellovibrionales bacterium]|nr:hypothetical protein [Bdellovibrionales bacterium]